MLHGPAQTVEFPDHKRVASAQKGQGIIQAGAFGFGTGDDIVKHGLAAHRFKCINLRFQILVCCSDPRISNQSHEDILVRFPVHQLVRILVVRLYWRT